MASAVQSKTGIIIILLLLISSPAFADTWALLVAIDDYQDEGVSDLKYTVNDVAQFCNTLMEIGKVPKANVYLMTNQSSGENLPTDTNVLFRLENLASRIRPDDTFIFYFSGHGMMREGKQYLLSINSDPRSLTTLAKSAIPLEDIQELLGKIGARQIIIILDACRNDPGRGKGDEDNKLTDGLARGFIAKPVESAIAQPRSAATLYASSVGERAYEWPDTKSGVFSFYLLEGLRGKAIDANKKVTVRGLAEYVANQVVTWSREHLPPGKSQTPWLVTEGAADITLATLEGQTPMPPPKTALAPPPVPVSTAPLPLTVSVKSENGSAQPKIENELVKAINELGYPVKNDAPILIEGLLSTAGERQIPGVPPKFMMNFKLDVKIMDSENLDTIESFDVIGTGLGNSREEAIQKGSEKLKIDKAKLSQALTNCKERRARLSMERFNEGEKLFRNNKYREALNKLKGVYAETVYFSQAQAMIQNIRMIMPKPTIAILKFKTNSDSITDGFRSLLTSTLVRTESEEISILEREQMSEILKEQKLELDGLVDPATASEFGRLTGSDFLLLGSLSVSGNQVEIDARLADVGTSQIIAALHETVSKEQTETFARKLIAEIRTAIDAGKLDKVWKIQTPVDELKDVILKKNLRVMIVIPETHIHRPVPDPAAETEMIRKFIELGFKVVDQSYTSKIRDSREAKAAADGDNQAAIAIARQYEADVIIVGEAFSENIPTPVQEIQTCSARVEARAIERDTGIILAANGKKAHAKDATEFVAAKKALQTAGGLLGDDMIRQIVKTWQGQGGANGIELSVRGVEYKQLALIESFLKEQEDILKIRRRDFDDYGTANIDIQSNKDAKSLADALSRANLADFSINIEAQTANTVEVSVVKK